jgi:hypothetical protein
LKLKIQIFFFFTLIAEGFGQSIPPGIDPFYELSRRNQISGKDSLNSSFTLRPNLDYIFFPEFSETHIVLDSTKKIQIELLPIISLNNFNSDRPYGSSPFLQNPNVGLQNYLSFGIKLQAKFFHFQFQPEFNHAQNRPYFGFQPNFPARIIRDRFHFWNYDDTPEMFGKGSQVNAFWGQSSASVRFGSFETGISTRNIWWGPGQWNSLTFSNNAQGFPHLSLNTYKPAQTFLGTFEFQVLVGRLENSGIGSSQFDILNQNYFRPFNDDWRYLNAFTATYGPKWINGLFVGVSRTYQQYNDKRGKSFRDYFPIFDPFQKERVFQNGNTVDFDSEARDQQATIFLRYFNEKSNAELYFEYGRRDHAFNIREFVLNPEHARAYLFGFKKLVDLSELKKSLQIRGEITHQQESVNRYIRYLGLGGEASWHTHYQVRGFVNRGQPLGVGIGTGANVQTLEFALVEKFNKIGVLFERLENHQDFYYRAFGQQQEHQPWVDLSLGFLFDRQWNNLLLTSKFQLINGVNYQWQLHPNSTPDFPRGQNLLSIHSQLNLIYFLNPTQKFK